MIEPKQSLPFRLGHLFLQFALRLWPEESRGWGQALAAELHEIEKPFEALKWALGGVMLFSRASASHFLAWLKLPAGSRLSAASLRLGADAPILPKRSRLFTAVVLLGTCLLFFFPQTREAVSTVRASWNGYRGYSSDVRTLQNLAARAEKEKNARTLAFVAVATPDAKEAVRLADHAVAIDPHLAWIYASRARRGEFAPPSKDGLARLLVADPDNAVPEIFAAQVISEPLLQGLIARHSQTEEEIERFLAANPEWIAHMDRAFRAPRYDSYFDRHWQLTREVWNNHPDLSVSLVLNSLWAHRLPDVLSITRYGNYQVHKAQQASAEGHITEAETLLKYADGFGRRMSDQGESDFERTIGLNLAHKATAELQSLYRAQRKEPDARQAAERLQEIDARIDGLVHSSQSLSVAQFRVFDRRALMIQLSAAMAVALVIVAAISLCALELRFARRANHIMKFRRALCMAVDWTPLALLTGCVALLWLFQPYAQVLRSARTLTSGSGAWYSMHFQGLFTLSSTLGVLEEPFTPVHFWQAFICALVALVLYVIVRGFLHLKRA